MSSPSTKLEFSRSCLAVSLISLGALGLMIGCEGGSGPKRLALAGSVSLDRMPIEDATIILQPIGEGLPGIAAIEHGGFAFSSKSGPSPGDYFVVINPEEADIQNSSPDQNGKQPSRIPDQFQNPGKLKVTVTGDENQELNFVLSSDA